MPIRVASRQRNRSSTPSHGGRSPPIAGKENHTELIPFTMFTRPIGFPPILRCGQRIGRYTFHCLVTVSNINYQCPHCPAKGQHRNTSHGWLARLHTSAIAHVQLSNFRVCRRLILPCFGVQSFAMSRSKLFALSSCPYPITSACFCQALFLWFFRDFFWIHPRHVPAGNLLPCMVILLIGRWCYPIQSC